MWQEKNIYKFGFLKKGIKKYINIFIIYLYLDKKTIPKYNMAILQSNLFIIM